MCVFGLCGEGVFGGVVCVFFCVWLLCFPPCFLFGESF